MALYINLINATILLSISVFKNGDCNGTSLVTVGMSR